MRTHVCICVSKYIYRETEMCNHTQTDTYFHKDTDTEHRYIYTHKHTYILTADKNIRHFTLSLALSPIAASACMNACARACVCVCVCACVQLPTTTCVVLRSLSPYFSLPLLKRLSRRIHTHTYAHTQTLSHCLLLSFSDCRHHHASFRKYE